MAAGERIRRITGDETVGFYVSPFQRTIQTMRGIRKAWADRPELQNRDTRTIRDHRDLVPQV